MYRLWILLTLLASQHHICFHGFCKLNLQCWQNRKTDSRSDSKRIFSMRKPFSCVFRVINCKEIFWHVSKEKKNTPQSSAEHKQLNCILAKPSSTSLNLMPLILCNSLTAQRQMIFGRNENNCRNAGRQRGPCFCILCSTVPIRQSLGLPQ